MEMAMRKSGLSDEQRASELAAVATEDDDHPGDGWTCPPSIATAAERMGWIRHANGGDSPTQPARFVGWLAREIAAGSGADLPAIGEASGLEDPTLIESSADALDRADVVQAAAELGDVLVENADHIAAGMQAGAISAVFGPKCVTSPAIAGCPRNECQIRNKCTRTTVCLSRAALYESERLSEPDCRDEDDAPIDVIDQIPFLPTLITCSTSCGAATALEAAPVMGWAMIEGRWYCMDHRSRIAPTPRNCKLMGAERCEHSDMTAEETQVVFGKDGAE